MYKCRLKYLIFFIKNWEAHISLRQRLVEKRKDRVNLNTKYVLLLLQPKEFIVSEEKTFQDCIILCIRILCSPQVKCSVQIFTAYYSCKTFTETEKTINIFEWKIRHSPLLKMKNTNYKRNVEVSNAVQNARYLNLLNS